MATTKGASWFPLAKGWLLGWLASCLLRSVVCCLVNGWKVHQKCDVQSKTQRERSRERVTKTC